MLDLTAVLKVEITRRQGFQPRDHGLPSAKSTSAPRSIEAIGTTSVAGTRTLATRAVQTSGASDLQRIIRAAKTCIGKDNRAFDDLTGSAVGLGYRQHKPGKVE